MFRAFAETVAAGQDGFVILDTAPTGHTLLLLDAAEAYHREVLRTSSAMPEPVQQLLPRLRDPLFTRVLLVTLPEATPVHEAERLQSDLRRAGIEPIAWVINQSVSTVRTTDPVLLERGRREIAYIEEVQGRLASSPFFHGVRTSPWDPRPFRICYLPLLIQPLRCAEVRPGHLGLTARLVGRIAACPRLTGGPLRPPQTRSEKEYSNELLVLR